MNRHERRNKQKQQQRRKASKQKREFHTMKDGTKVLVTKEIDLCDPNLDPKHRDTFIYAVRTEVVRLDEVLSRWYRRPVCNVPDCDCGEAELFEQVWMLCSHLDFVKETFGEDITDKYPHFRRALRECTREGCLRIVEENDAPVMYLEADGKQIAKRYPGERWINLEPGYTVRGGEPGDGELPSIEYDPTHASPQ
jgi:hypothetical protein